LGSFADAVALGTTSSEEIWRCADTRAVRFGFTSLISSSVPEPLQYCIAQLTIGANTFQIKRIYCATHNDTQKAVPVRGAPTMVRNPALYVICGDASRLPGRGSMTFRVSEAFADKNEPRL
jgi:hypothetical protein